jgi:hypothetical protein
VTYGKEVLFRVNTTLPHNYRQGITRFEGFENKTITMLQKCPRPIFAVIYNCAGDAMERCLWLWH